MPEQLKKLQHFMDNVAGAAEREDRERRRRLEANRKKALRAAKAAAWDSARAYYDQEAAAIRAQAGHELSRHMLEGKRQIYRRRSEIAVEVKQRVLERLERFVTTPDYPVCLQNTLHAVMQRLGEVEEIELRLRRADLPLAPALAESVAPVKVTVHESHIKYGGLNVRCPALGIRVDCSFDAQLEEMSSHFAEMFGLSLSDDLEKKDQNGSI